MGRGQGGGEDGLTLHHAAARSGRARLIRSRSQGEFIASHRSVRRCTVQPELGVVAEDARKDERRRRGDGSAILAQLVDVLALNPHGLCQSALGEPHRCIVRSFRGDAQPCGAGEAGEPFALLGRDADAKRGDPLA